MDFKNFGYDLGVRADRVDIAVDVDKPLDSHSPSSALTCSRIFSTNAFRAVEKAVLAAFFLLFVGFGILILSLSPNKLF